jgi:hypothetical protein
MTGEALRIKLGARIAADSAEFFNSIGRKGRSGFRHENAVSDIHSEALVSRRNIHCPFGLDSMGREPDIR